MTPTESARQARLAWRRGKGRSRAATRRRTERERRNVEFRRRLAVLAREVWRNGLDLPLIDLDVGYCGLDQYDLKSTWGVS